MSDTMLGSGRSKQLTCFACSLWADTDRSKCVFGCWLLGSQCPRKLRSREVWWCTGGHTARARVHLWASWLQNLSLNGVPAPRELTAPLGRQKCKEMSRSPAGLWWRVTKQDSGTGCLEQLGKPSPDPRRWRCVRSFVTNNLDTSFLLIQFPFCC